MIRVSRIVYVHFSGRVPDSAHAVFRRDQAVFFVAVVTIFKGVMWSASHL